MRDIAVNVEDDIWTVLYSIKNGEKKAWKIKKMKNLKNTHTQKISQVKRARDNIADKKTQNFIHCEIIKKWTKYYQRIQEKKEVERDRKNGKLRTLPAKFSFSFSISITKTKNT